MFITWAGALGGGGGPGGGRPSGCVARALVARGVAWCQWGNRVTVRAADPCLTICSTPLHSLKPKAISTKQCSCQHLMSCLRHCHAAAVWPAVCPGSVWQQLQCGPCPPRVLVPSLYNRVLIHHWCRHPLEGLQRGHVVPARQEVLVRQARGGLRAELHLESPQAVAVDNCMSLRWARYR